MPTRPVQGTVGLELVDLNLELLRLILTNRGHDAIEELTGATKLKRYLDPSPTLPHSQSLSQLWRVETVDWIFMSEECGPLPFKLGNVREINCIVMYSIRCPTHFPLIVPNCFVPNKIGINIYGPP